MGFTHCVCVCQRWNNTMNNTHSKGEKYCSFVAKSFFILAFKYYNYVN